MRYNVTLLRFVPILLAGGNDIDHMLSPDAIITRLATMMTCAEKAPWRLRRCQEPRHDGHDASDASPD